MNDPAPVRWFNAEMLTLARARERITQSQLGERIGVKQAVISKIEGGVRPPTDDEREKLAKSLNVPISFFDRPKHDRFYGVVALFRLQRKRVSKVGLDFLNAEFVTRAMHLRELLENVDVTPGLPLPRFADGFDPVTAAEQLRQMWLVRPGPIQNLTALVEAAGVCVIELDATIDEFEGAAFRAPGLPAIIFVRKGQSADRRRFTLAHELAHLILHESPDDLARAEKEANVFAQELLFPEPFARKWIGVRPRLPALRSNRLAWKVSIQAQVMIAERLELVSPATKSRLFQQIGALGWRTKEPDALPPEVPELFSTVLRTVTDDLAYSPKELATLLDESPQYIETRYGVTERKLGPLRVLS